MAVRRSGHPTNFPQGRRWTWKENQGHNTMYALDLLNVVGSIGFIAHESLLRSRARGRPGALDIYTSFLAEHHSIGAFGQIGSKSARLDWYKTLSLEYFRR
jgi:hypothetical protein